eukprot:Rhum_TRINITY_DN12208_c0_g2::Rhum_TRINITY_DN12208_c0_g2_i1::g.50388::m.50388
MRAFLGCLLLAGVACADDSRQSWWTCRWDYYGNATGCHDSADCVWDAELSGDRMGPRERCWPKDFAEMVNASVCNGYCAVNLMYDMVYDSECRFAQSLKNSEQACSTMVSDDLTCRWTDEGKCVSRGLTGFLDKGLPIKDLLTNDGPGLRKCALDAMTKAGLSPALPEYGCGPSAVSPDCVTGVMDMGDDTMKCAKSLMETSLKNFYDENIRWEVESTEGVLDCTEKAIKECAFNERDFCAGVKDKEQGWEVPTVTMAKQCIADYNCLAEKYNACANKADFAPTGLPASQVLPADYQLVVATQTCMQQFSTECGGSVADVMDSCLKFTDVNLCAERLACYAKNLGACGVQHKLWGDSTNRDFIAAGPIMTSNAKCFATELQACGFENGGFCSNGKVESFEAAMDCLGNFACMAKAVAPCQAAEKLVGWAAGGQGLCGPVNDACEDEVCGGYPEIKSQCMHVCRIVMYTRCSVSTRHDTTVDFLADQIKEQVLYNYACLESASNGCNYDADTFCTSTGDTPTAAEAAVCKTQVTCSAKPVFECLKKFKSNTVDLLEGVKKMAEAVDRKYHDKLLATRTCIEVKQAVCGADINDLGFNVALCLADPTECATRAWCILKEAHQCGVDTGFLRSGAQELLDSTTYTRCLLAELQDTDLAQKLADLDYDFFFDPSTKLMQAHAKCAGWSLSKMTTILPKTYVDPVRRQVSSAEFCARSITSICEPFDFDEAASAMCALAAVYRCRDGTEYNKRVDACFTDAAGECGAVKGQATWANVQGVDCVNDVMKCAEMAACLTAKVSTCLGTFVGEEVSLLIDKLEGATAKNGGAVDDASSGDGGPPVLIIAVAAGAGVVAMALAVGFVVTRSATKPAPSFGSPLSDHMNADCMDVQLTESPSAFAVAE